MYVENAYNVYNENLFGVFYTITNVCLNVIWVGTIGIYVSIYEEVYIYDFILSIIDINKTITYRKIKFYTLEHTHTHTHT